MGHRQAPGRVVKRGPPALQLLGPLRSSLSLVRKTVSRPHAPFPSLKHLLCQTDTCPAQATDIVHMAGVREPREVGKPAWGSAAQQGADDNR